MKKATNAVVGRFGRRRKRRLSVGIWVLSRSAGVGLRVWHGLGLGKVVEGAGWWGRAGAGSHLRGTGGRQESEQRFPSGGNSASLPRGVVWRQFWLSQFAGCGEGCSCLKAGRGLGCSSTYHSAQLAAPTTNTNPETSIVLRRGKASVRGSFSMKPREGKGCPLQYSGLENSRDCTFRGVAKSRTQLSDFHLLS